MQAINQDMVKRARHSMHELAAVPDVVGTVKDMKSQDWREVENEAGRILYAGVTSLTYCDPGVKQEQKPVGPQNVRD